MQFDGKGFSDEQLIHIYTELVRPRMIEERCSYCCGRAASAVV